MQVSKMYGSENQSLLSLCEFNGRPSKDLKPQGTQMAKYKRAIEIVTTNLHKKRHKTEPVEPEPETLKASFKKRYGDLRRHSQNWWPKDEIAQLKQQLDTAAKVKSIS